MNDLITLLLEKSDRALEDAQYLYFERKSYEASISRAYYAMFYAAEAALLTKGETTVTHKGLSMLFSKHFIKGGLLEPEYGRMLSNVFRQRQLSDYEIRFEANAQDADLVIDNAESFIQRIKSLLADPLHSLAS
ncbi:HEPN domain-containing protein [Larkinella insperata]|uniref:HEPN domain-containing protein n=1 Tax=Larkinella insperata TaxID=332158 RepID=A0ABW3QEF3_9BACT|nr:HEPN domain-containing protein [Larkinella insperata]